MQMPTLETRVTALEAIQAQINERLGSIEGRLTSLETRMDSGFRDVQTAIRWLVGLLVIVLIANIGTAVSIIIALAKP